jgi:uncharacterized protein YfaS (alpha-2-macroglobulin family)
MPSHTEHVAHLTDDYLHELLPPDEAQYVERHSGDCPDCARALDQARRRLALLQAVPPVEPPAGLVEATLDRVHASDSSRARLRRGFAIGAVAALAASVLVLLGLNIYYARLAPPALDLVVLGQRELLAATTASLRVRVMDRQAGVALAGVPVVVTLKGTGGRSQELARFTTDEQGSGSPRFELPDWADGGYQLEVVARAPAGTEKLTRPVQLRRSWKLMLSSDKPVYQPGQKILLRALALRRPDLRPVAGKSAVFTLADPRGNVLFKHSHPTSKFGITSAECELAQEVQEGAYRVGIDVEGTKSELSVEVRRYVLPKFKVAVRPDRPYYAPGQTATITFQADYFFGKPVANATLEVRMRTLTGQEVGKPAAARTDAQGGYRLTFKLPAELAGRENDQGDARVAVVATVTDSAGQKQAASGELLMTTRPVRVEALPEAGQLVQSVANTVYLLVRQADGTPVRGARVEVNGDATADVKTDDRGAASFQVTPHAAEVGWTLRVSDAAGEVLARRNDRLQLGSVPGDFLVRLDRAVYKAGQSMRLTALGGGAEPVFVDLVKDGQTMLSQAVELHDGQGELVVDLPADLFGTLQLVAYRFAGPSGLPVRKARALFVTPPEGLRVQATLDRPEYRPGREATVRVRLTDDRGRPTPGAVSLAAVDEAVYSVLSQGPGMEQAFYNLEQELLKPVYAIYPWQPEADGRSALRDRALFAATSQGIGTLPEGNGSLKQTPQLSEAGAHTLAVRSLPIREQETEARRAQGLHKVRIGWAGVVAAALFCAYLALWMYLPLTEVIRIHAYGGGALFLIAVVGIIYIGVTDSGPGATGGKLAAVFDKSASMSVREPRVLEPFRDPNNFFLADGVSNTFVAGERPAPRVRRHFPETLLWKPELITDDQGNLAPLKVTLADSITTWRLSASAVAADGRLGAARLPLKVFQPFFVDLNLPVSLTRNDEVGVPVVVYNYLDKPQTVTLTLAEAPWFALEGPAEQKLELAGGEVRSTRFTLKVRQVGQHRLKVTALAGGVGDAVEREIEVVPDGRKVEVAFSGGLAQPAEHTLEVPADAVEGSVKAFVKVYPSGFSQLVEGLDGIFRMPYGCFEQTSSTTYPNVLALDYLRRNRLSVPAVEAKARQYIHLGYQRLVGFEVPGGGFDWYGRPPASIALTAYGLLEFSDMARVHDVDPNLLERTHNWLLSQRQADGSWSPDLRAAHLAGVRDQAGARLATTAYTAWAVFRGGKAPEQARLTLDWLLGHRPSEIKDPHTLALVSNALLAIDPQGKDTPAYLDQLARLAKRGEDGRFVHWEQEAGRQTIFYGGGLAGQVETTALAALALMEGRRHPEAARAALAWLVARKDPAGTWHSTQATVLALKALLAGSAAGGEAKERRIELRVGKHAEEVVIPADQAEVLRLIDVSRHLAAGGNRLSLAEKSATGAGYQVVLRYHVPEPKAKAPEGPLAITLDYDRTELAVGGAVAVKAAVVNRQEVSAPMVMLDLPVPPGFAPAAEDFQALVTKGSIARFQAQPRSVLVYLRGLEPGQKLELGYRLRATMPVRVAAPGARVYEYYDPQKQATSRPERFVVRPGE